MSLFSWLRTRTSNSPTQTPSPRRRAARRVRPRLETLEGRALPTAFFAATAADLIADINAANKAGGANTITLTAPTTSPYFLTAVNNTTDGATGTPVISGGSVERKLVTAADNLTIVGNGDTIERSTASRTPAFRLFDVATGGSLTLENLTLGNGLAYGTGSAAQGGAIRNQGNLLVSQVTVGKPGLGNEALGLFFQSKKGSSSGDAAGGGIWSSGALTVENQSVIESNTVSGEGSYGGGICSSGTLTVESQSVIQSNTVIGGSGYGGGIWSSGALTVENQSVIQSNTVSGENNGSGYGGGICSSGTLTVESQSVIQSNTVSASVIGAGNGSGYGGGICSSGTLTVESQSVIQSNTVIGAGNGSGYGGGIAITGGTANIDSSTIGSFPLGFGYGGNSALGGYDPNTGTYAPDGPGAGYGGGLYVGSGSVTLTNNVIEGNSAGSYINGAFEGFDDLGYGGGIYIASGATVYLDTNTLNNTNNNTGSWPSATTDIYGQYTLLA